MLRIYLRLFVLFLYVGVSPRKVKDGKAVPVCNGKSLILFVFHLLLYMDIQLIERYLHVIGDQGVGDALHQIGFDDVVIFRERPHL